MSTASMSEELILNEIRRRICEKLVKAFEDELSLLGDMERSILIDDMVTAFIERMRVMGNITAIVRERE